MKLVGIWKSNECMNTCAENTVTIILEVYKLSRKSVYYNNTQWGGWVVLYGWSEHFHLSWIAEGPQWKKSQNPRIHSSYRKGGIQGKLRFYKKWMRKTGSQTKEIDQKDKTHTGKTQGHQKEPKHQEPDKSPEWKQSLRYSQECKNTYNQTHELYHYRSDTVQVWINVLIRYWKKKYQKEITRRKSWWWLVLWPY